MWYERALKEMGMEKSLDLDVTLVPHTQDPEDTRKKLSHFLTRELGRKHA